MERSNQRKNTARESSGSISIYGLRSSTCQKTDSQQQQQRPFQFDLDVSAEVAPVNDADLGQ